MADGLRDIRNVFQGLQTLYETYLPKVDPILIHDLLVREKEKFDGGGDLSIFSCITNVRNLSFPYNFPVPTSPVLCKIVRSVL